MDKKSFFNILFDPEQQTCYTEKPTGTAISPHAKPGDLYFCINALDPYTDHLPTEDWHDELRPRRADHNVTCFRNFLIELDDIPLTEQIAYVESLVPVSTIVYSGNKSYHFIISLVHPLNSLEEYREVAARLHALIPKADKACRNPSRLSRLPIVLRPDTGRLQTLIKVGTRIDNDLFMDKLPKLQYSKKHLEKGSGLIKVELVDNVMRPNKTMENLKIGGRNAFFFWLGNRLKDADIEDDTRVRLVELAYENLKDTSGFSINEAFSAARVRRYK